MDPRFILSRLSDIHPPMKGAQMKTSLSFKNVDVREPVEIEVGRNLGKVEKLLKSYASDLVQLHGAFEKHPRKTEYEFSLNLSLPTGTLHATATGSDVRSSVKSAFSDLATQIKKHQAKLRKDYEWKRKRPRREAFA
ncbi:MAG TPA: HPF/RaiA family ribosome-associated protein [Candidatus Nitrosotenuis sp.]|nr:HPF/RaiA family ribosome-associated protein [Candidatus Nitrosotenuis sp.]